MRLSVFISATVSPDKLLSDFPRSVLKLLVRCHIFGPSNFPSGAFGRLVLQPIRSQSNSCTASNSLCVYGKRALPPKRVFAGNCRSQTRAAGQTGPL